MDGDGTELRRDRIDEGRLERARDAFFEQLGKKLRGDVGYYSDAIAAALAAADRVSPDQGEREKFEHWLKASGSFTDWSRDKTDEANPYHKPLVERTWQAWCASAALRHPAPSVSPATDEARKLFDRSAALIERHRDDKRYLVPDNEVMELCDLLEAAIFLAMKAVSPAKAEGWNAAIQACIEAQPFTAENPNESSYLKGHFDGVMDYGREIRKLRCPAPPATDKAAS